MAAHHQQICWSATHNQAVPVLNATTQDQYRDQIVYQEINRLTPQPGCDPSEESISPHPVLSDTSFMLQLQRFHDILVKAVVNVVERWWEDEIAGLPLRMPLEGSVEEVLQVSIPTYILYEKGRTQNSVHQPAESRRIVSSLFRLHWPLAA